MALTLLEVGVTIARNFTTSLVNDRGDVGFFLGISPIMSAENIQETVIHIVINAGEKKLKFNLNTVVSSDYYDVCLEVDGEREDGRWNSVTLFRIPGDSDNSNV